MITRTLKSLRIYCVSFNSKFGVMETYRRAKSFEYLIINRMPKRYRDRWIVVTDFETKEKKYSQFDRSDQ